MSVRRAMAIACICGTAGVVVAQTVSPATDREPESWRPMAGYSDQPFCQLYAPHIGDSQRGFVLVPYWNARQGWALWFLTHQKEIRSVRFEAPGTQDAWEVALEPATEDFHGRYALLEPDVADSMLRSLEQGHAWSASVRYEGLPPLDSPIPTRGASIGAAMYRACVQSLRDDSPPKYLFEPQVVFRAFAQDTDRCGFWQLIELERIPVQVSLLADTDGATVTIARELASRRPHGPFQEREVPDRVDATQLFGSSFDLAETFDFRITKAQLEVLGLELAQGKSRALWLTSKAGKKAKVEFGGKWGKPTAAMFAACRKARRTA
jgi:hypothetical protein